MLWRNLCCLIGTILFVGCSLQYSNRSWSTPNFKIEAEERNGLITGDWKCNADAFGDSPFAAGTSANMEIREVNGGKRSYFGAPIQEIEGLMPAMKDGATLVDFRITAPAGEIRMTGNREKEFYAGTFDFRPNSSFAQECGSLLSDRPSDWQLLELCLARVDLDYIQRVAKGAPERPSTDEVVRLRRSGVSAEYLHAMEANGIGHIPDIVAMRNNGVQPDLVAALKGANYNFTPQEIIRLRNSGVTPSFASAWRDAGFSLESEELIRLRNSGVPQEYGKALRDSGRDWEVQEIIRLRNSGVSADYVSTILEVAPELESEEIVRLRNSGVPADYFRAWASAGYKANAQDIVRLRNAGVPLAYAEALKQTGKAPLNVDEIIQLRNRGVSAELLQRLRQ